MSSVSTKSSGTGIPDNFVDDGCPFPFIVLDSGDGDGDGDGGHCSSIAPSIGSGLLGASLGALLVAFLRASDGRFLSHIARAAAEAFSEAFSLILRLCWRSASRRSFT